MKKFREKLKELLEQQMDEVKTQPDYILLDRMIKIVNESERVPDAKARLQNVKRQLTDIIQSLTEIEKELSTYFS